jgi:hypothetical protein
MQDLLTVFRNNTNTVNIAGPFLPAQSMGSTDMKYNKNDNTKY